MQQLPAYLGLSMALVTIITVLAFYRASKYSRWVLGLLLALLTIQSAVTVSGFYTDTHSMPPRFVFLVGPAFAAIFILFMTGRGKRFLSRLDLKTLTLLHAVRIPVELVLFGLYRYGTVPQLMTFEAGNLDILSGLSAPIIALLAFRGNEVRSPRLLLGWNLVCLGLLANIVIRATLAAPTPFQQWGFEQPNIAVLYFPFSWLACCIVPLVLLSHLAAVRTLLRLMPSSKTALATAHQP